MLELIHITEGKLLNKEGEYCEAITRENVEITEKNVKDAFELLYKHNLNTLLINDGKNHCKFFYETFDDFLYDSLTLHFSKNDKPDDIKVIKASRAKQIEFIKKVYDFKWKKETHN